MTRTPPTASTLAVQIVGAMQQFTAALTEAARTLGRLFGQLAVDPEALIRRRLGPGQLTADGRWQSSACAVWLHEECRAPAPLCQCTCHPGGTLR